MKLKKCKNCKTYTLEERCPKCNNKTSEAHYKIEKIKISSKANERIMVDNRAE